MMEFLVGNYIVDRINHKKKIKEGFTDTMERVPFFDVSDQTAVAVLIVSLVISFITAYIAFICNGGENAGVRFITTIFAFFFSVTYFIYFFIIYIIFDAKCSGSDDIIPKNISLTINKKSKRRKSK